jgi:acyl-homoserine lactone acylase PvdQ
VTFTAARRTLACAIALLVLVLVPTAASAAVQPYQANDYGGGGFHDILPPGAHGSFNSADFTQFELAHTYPAHATDQLSMYENLVYNTPGLTYGQIPNFFKDSSFGTQPGNVERTYSPRAGCTVQRDNFGLAHVYGDTRSDTVFCAGYVGAEDRLFFMDVLRHAGRAQLSGFAGGANKAMDADVWSNSPYTEADLQEQVDKADDLYGAEGAQLQQDVVDYVAGINQYISEARTDSTKLPYEYGAIGKTLDDWKPTDVIATAALIGGIFGKGGGGEIGNALTLEAAKARYGGAGGEQAWRDFRRQDDPEAPTTVNSTNGSFDYPRQRGSSGIAMPDPGSIVDPPNSGSALIGSGTAGGLLGGLGSMTAMSNALLVSAAKSESGHPVAVIGPQVAYFMPEILVEEDLHGPDIDAQGAAFAGVSPYVLLGRGQDFAWSATSAGQDIIDTFAEKLCEPDGSQPTVQSTHYLYKGECRAMETLTRVNDITPNPGDPSPPETYTLEAQRTVHGIVSKRGTVDGQPVAFARQRSSYFHEADSARAFADLNRPSKVQNVQDFQHVVSKINFTFNWFYADDQDIGYFNSGDNPERAAGADPDFPNWGTGEYDWKGWETTFKTEDVTPFDEHPQVVNQPYITSWNNKQAAGFDAADGNYAYGPIYRSQSLDAQINQRLAGSDKMSLPELIDSMELAGTTDLRATQVLPLLLQVVGTPSDPQQAAAVNTLQAWLDAGAHRIDRDQNGNYDNEQAIQILDAWWPRLVEGEFKPEMGNGFFDAVHGMQGFDNDPNNHGDHLGSAYQDGWYGFVSKDLRRVLGQPVSDGFSRTYCGSGSLTACRDALRQTLSDALGDSPAQLYDENKSTPATDRVDTCPAGKSDQWCWDSVRFRPIGGITLPTIHWINRPTFQQAVEILGHRARGYARPKGATPLRVSLVPAYRACSAPNRTHGAPLAFGSCAAPVQRSDYLTVGTGDANGKITNSVGSVRFDVAPGDPLATGDQADVLVDASLSDVRNQSGLGDYAGELGVGSTLRITDRNNGSGGPSGSDPATVSDLPLGVTMPCVATADPSIGGSCAVSTSLDSLVPGTVREGDRSIWQLDQVTVSDGGSDGLVSTSPNTLFARQGVFVP